MNKIAEEQIDEILNSFKSDSTELPNDYAVRAAELADATTAKHEWFKYGFALTTVKSRREKRYYGIYNNSFSKQKNRLHEEGRVSLTSKKRI